MTLTEKIQVELKELPTEKQVEVLDFIAFLRQRAHVTRSPSEAARRRRRLKRAFATLAEMGTFADIQDPVEWQRQIRKDRPLPGREE